MKLARVIRISLGLVAVAIIAWSFFDVGRRVIEQRRAEHDRPVTLTILHWGEPAEAQIVQHLVETYEKQNPRVRIVRIHIGDAGDMRNKLRTMMAAGTAPDLFYLPPDLLPELANLKLVKPLDEYVQRDIAAGNKAWFDDFFPVLIDAFKYDTKSAQFGRGTLYALPKGFTTAVFYINVDLFKKAGLRIPYDGWTWDEFENDCKKITALSNTKEFAGRKIFGGHFAIWPDTLRQIIWSHGGDFFGTRVDGSADFKNVTLDSPASQEALEMIRRTRFDEKCVFNAAGVAKDGGQEFYTGNIGCYGPLGRWQTPRFKDIADFKWDVVPTPAKTAKDNVSQIFTVAWTMSAGTKQPDESYKLMKFLCSGEGAIEQCRMGLEIPPTRSMAFSEDFKNPAGIPKHHSEIFLKQIDVARLQQIPREPEWNEILDDKIKRSIQMGDELPMENAKEIAGLWLSELNSPLRVQEWKPMRWDVVVFATIAVCAVVVTLLWMKARREKLGPLDRATERAGFMFIMPWLIGFLALTLGPMIVSLLMSFTKWSAMTPMSNALSVGTANYRQLFQRDPQFYQAMRVTFYYVILAVPFTQIGALFVAILMNNKVRGIAIFRTVFFIPSLIVASVVGAVIWMQMYNNDYGIVNAILRPILAPLHMQPPDWFGTDARAWAIPAFVFMGLWGVGGAMILYLAGLKGIPASLYEAATIDGAGPMRRLWNVTLPMLSPLIFYNLVMGLIGSFQVFVQPMVMTKGGPNDLTLFYVLDLYRQAFEFHNMGYASALAWILFIILLVLTIVIFRGSRSLVYYEGLKQ